MCARLSRINASKDKTANQMRETNIDPSELPYVACVIHMTVSLQVYALCIRMC